MAQPAVTTFASAAEYLAFERAAPDRHELIDGEVVAMSGGTREHSLIALNIGDELRAALRERPCEVFSSDMRIKVAATGRYTYPDVAALRGAPEFEDEARDTLLNPAAVFEVLSDSTESYDRGEKFAQYRQLPSLTDYVLASQKAMLVEHFHRQPDGSWLLRVCGPGERVALAALGCDLALDEVYLKVFAQR
jgi:Uma2 family endonuclease